MNDAPPPDNGETPEKDVPLRYDTRLLGRILGDTVRSQEGEQVFDLVEHIRRTGVQFHRNADEAARRELQSIMSGLPTREAIRIIRAFGYFSHLANLAEDQHHIRRTRAYAMAEAPPRRGTMAYALARAQDAGVTRDQLEGFFARALCVAVLTAHPTEVRRQSTIDREREIARLLDERDRLKFTPEELTANRRALRRNVLTLWQTSLIRHSRLRVLDEVTNALAYYDHTFLAALPEFYADLEDQLGFDVPSFLRMGSWIGGDRDGNPNVTAEVTRETLAMQSQHALRHHLEELHLLGAELPLYGSELDRLARVLSLSDQRVKLPETLRLEIADALSGLDLPPALKNEPFRCLCIGMGQKLRALLADDDRPKYHEARDLLGDLKTIMGGLGRIGLELLHRAVG